MDFRLVLIDKYNENAILNLVFVHGLTGDVFETWNGKKNIKVAKSEYYELAKKEDINDEYWPLRLMQRLNKNENNVNVWSLGYPTSLVKEKEVYSYVESIKTASENIVSKLSVDKLNKPYGPKLVFIAHSLGGIITKAILSNCKLSIDSDRNNIFKNTKGVAFLGTPNYGSGLANVLQFISETVPSLLPPVISTFVKNKFQTSNAINWLEKNNPELRTLANEFRLIVQERKLEIKVYYETKPFKGIKVVDEANSDPGITGCFPEAAPKCDHNQISKPSNKNDFIHDQISKWLENITHNLIKGTREPVLKDQIKKALKNILNSDSTIPKESVLKIPKKIEELDKNYRITISHNFRAEAYEIGKDLILDNHDTESKIDLLMKSDYDFDKLILYQILSLRLYNTLNVYQSCIAIRKGEIYNKEDPSLIMTYELIRSLWSSMSRNGYNIKSEMKSFLKWLKKVKSKNEEVDSDSKTENFLRYSIKCMAEIEEWEKP